MSDLTLVRTGRAVAASSIALVISSLIVAAAAGQLEFWWRSYAGAQAGLAVAFGIFVWLVVPRQPRNATVWAMAVSGANGLTALALAVAGATVEGDPMVIVDLDRVPPDLPPAIGWFLAVGNAASILGLFVPLTLGLIWFPDGRLPSRRWRPVVALVVIDIAVFTAAQGWWYRPGDTVRPESPLSIGAAFVCILLVAISVVSLFGRFRRSTGVTRMQYKWVLWGTGIGAMVFAGFFFVPDSNVDSYAAVLVATVAATAWVVCYGVAVGRYRLYEIDVVISRTVVFVSLAALITGTYAVVVIVVGSLVGSSDIWLSVLATALVAIAFEPALRRTRRWANRLVYGRRATPYEVLGELTRLLAVAESSTALLDRVAWLLWSATGADRVTVWVDEDGAATPVSVAPVGEPAEAATTDGEVAVRVVPIRHEGERLGQITIERRSATALHPAEIRLAGDLAASAALVVAKVRLERALVAKADEITDSRQRLVGAQDREVRRLEQELNDRVGEQVVALRVHVGLAERIALEDGTPRVASLLGAVGEDTQTALDQIRALARGIHPPLLDSDGLLAAITSAASRCAHSVDVDIDPTERYPGAIESAVYFCVSEALTNASKHAAGPVSVTISDRDGTLSFAVTDAGPGFDTGSLPRGTGLRNIADRLDALGGTLRIASRPGSPTTITGTLPAVPLAQHERREPVAPFGAPSSLGG